MQVLLRVGLYQTGRLAGGVRLMSSAVDKATLSKLRKTTGFSFVNCRNALQQFNNDFEQARAWLQEQAQREGWARATKLMTRPMSQGLVAVVTTDRAATMVEVNCETDFVAKNEKFISLVTEVVGGCHNHFCHSQDGVQELGAGEGSKVALGAGLSLADKVALAVGNIGENMAFRRAVHLTKPEDGVLASYVHSTELGRAPILGCELGKFGAVLELERVTDDLDEDDAKELGVKICQHIVGLNPKTIGEEIDITHQEAATAEAATAEAATAEAATEGDAGSSEEETQLLQQEFIMDTSVTVGEILHRSGLRVRQFVRYERGEELPEDAAAAASD